MGSFGESAFARLKAGDAARRVAFGPDQRRAVLDLLARVVRDNRAQICAALAADLGKAAPEAELTELLPVLTEISHARRHLARWMRPRRVSGGLVGFGTVARVVPQPRGTCLILAPWNYPFSLAIGPLVSCLAAGNAAVVKPSELAPATSALIARLLTALPADLVAVVEGGREVAETLLNQRFDHIFFTGSPAVGKVVMAAAARSLASVTLELGGKSPCIIGPGADVARAARWVAFGKFSNAGQTCIAPDHVFVHHAVADGFRAALRAEIARMYPAGMADPALAQAVSDGHAARWRALLAGAQAAGARLISGGETRGRRMAPTLIEALTPDCALAQEEIFGPILPLIGFDDLAPVLTRINAGEKPLALYVFDRDRRFCDAVLAGTTSGSVGVNLTMLQFSHPGLPFGGVNGSGIGSAHGVWGFRAFSHDRAVLENRFSPLPLVFAPYGRRVRRLIAWASRVLT